MQMSENVDHLAGRGQLIVTGERDKNLVADAADIDDGLGRESIR